MCLEVERMVDEGRLEDVLALVSRQDIADGRGTASTGSGARLYRPSDRFASEGPAALRYPPLGGVPACGREMS